MSENKKEKELTERQKLFLHYLFDEETMGNAREAKRLAGYSENVSVTQVIDALSDEIIEYAKRRFASNASKAMFGVLSVLNEPAQAGAMNKLKAANEILNRAGIKEKSEQQEVKIPENGIVILPAKNQNLKLEITNNKPDNDSDNSNEG